MVILLNQQFREGLYKQELAKEVLKNQHNQKILNTSIKVQEDERKRIAQDLHDEIGATLSISRMHLLRLEKLAQSSKDQAISELPKVREYVEEALASIRRISYELMPAQLQTLGLEKALDGVSDSAKLASELDLQVTIQDDLSTLPWDVSLSVYRIYSELVNNTVKHAQATKVNLTIGISFHTVDFRYRDNGKGLPAFQITKALV